jgi:transposase-like protein
VHTSDIQLPVAARRRGRYSNEFKRNAIDACKQPGVSTAAVALANGLNANLLRRWISDTAKRLADLKSISTLNTLADSSKSTDVTVHAASIPRAASNSLAVIISLVSVDQVGFSIPTQISREAKMLRMIYPMLCKNSHYMNKTVDYEGLDGDTQCATVVADAGQARVRCANRRRH